MEMFPTSHNYRREKKSTKTLYTRSHTRTHLVMHFNMLNIIAPFCYTEFINKSALPKPSFVREPQLSVIIVSYKEKHFASGLLASKRVCEIYCGLRDLFLCRFHITPFCLKKTLIVLCFLRLIIG